MGRSRTVSCEFVGRLAAIGRGLPAAVTALLLIGVAGARAAEEPPGAPAPLTFMGVEVQPLSGPYLVLKDANVRAGPRTGARRLAGLDADDTVEAVGQPDGAAWIAVRHEGTDLGFVYAPLLLPMIDGRLNREDGGRTVLADGTVCRFRIRFAGRGNVQGAPFKTADYDVNWSCEHAGGRVEFYSLMFITEAPFAMSQSQIHQISIEIPDLADDYDRVMSTIVLYDRLGQRIYFDRVTVDDLATEPGVDELPAGSVREALVGAPAIAASAWNDSAWARLSGAVSEPVEDPEAPPAEDPEQG